MKLKTLVVIATLLLITHSSVQLTVAVLDANYDSSNCKDVRSKSQKNDVIVPASNNAHRVKRHMEHDVTDDDATDNVSRRHHIESVSAHNVTYYSSHDVEIDYDRDITNNNMTSRKTMDFFVSINVTDSFAYYYYYNGADDWMYYAYDTASGTGRDGWVRCGDSTNTSTGEEFLAHIGHVDALLQVSLTLLPTFCIADYTTELRCKYSHGEVTSFHTDTHTNTVTCKFADSYVYHDERSYYEDIATANHEKWAAAASDTTTALASLSSLTAVDDMTGLLTASTLNSTKYVVTSPENASHSTTAELATITGHVLTTELTIPSTINTAIEVNRILSTTEVNTATITSVETTNRKMNSTTAPLGMESNAFSRTMGQTTTLPNLTATVANLMILPPPPPLGTSSSGGSGRALPTATTRYNSQTTLVHSSDHSAEDDGGSWKDEEVWMIIGVVVGASVMLMGCCGGLAFLWWRKKRRKNTKVNRNNIVHPLPSPQKENTSRINTSASDAGVKVNLSWSLVDKNNFKSVYPTVGW